MSGTRLPEVLAELVALFAAADDLTVIDGPAFDPPAEFLTVGWDRSDAPAVTVTNARLDMPGGRGLETLAVSSLLSIAYDENDFAVGRARLFAAFRAYSAALVGNRSVSGVWQTAWITDYEYTPSLDEAGTIMDLRFTTQVEAVA